MTRRRSCDAETAIAAAARSYGGDPEAAGTLRNTEITEQSRVNVEVNAPPSLAGDVDDDTSWNDTGVSGGLGPCDPHPADDVSPNENSVWTQVGVRERDQLSLFGMFGLDLLRSRAHARVELQPALAGKGFIPVAVPEQDIVQARAAVLPRVRSGCPAAARDGAAEAARTPTIRTPAARRSGARPSVTSQGGPPSASR